MFATPTHFHPSLIFVGKDRSLPLEWSPIRGSTLIGYSLPGNIRVGFEEANTIAHYDTATITTVKSFIVHAQGWVFTKRFTNFLQLIFRLGSLITKGILTLLSLLCVVIKVLKMVVRNFTSFNLEFLLSELFFLIKQFYNMLILNLNEGTPQQNL